MLTLCVGSALMFRLGMYVAPSQILYCLYGMDSVRFTGATKIGDTIHCEVEMKRWKQGRPAGSHCRQEFPLKIKGEEDLVVYTTKDSRRQKTES